MRRKIREGQGRKDWCLGACGAFEHRRSGYLCTMALQVCLCERASANAPLQRALTCKMLFANVRNAFHYTNRCFSGPQQAIPSRATSNKVVLSGGLPWLVALVLWPLPYSGLHLPAYRPQVLGALMGAAGQPLPRPGSQIRSSAARRGSLGEDRSNVDSASSEGDPSLLLRSGFSEACRDEALDQ